MAAVQKRLLSLTLSPARQSDTVYVTVCFAHTEEIQQLKHASETDIQMAPDSTFGYENWMRCGLCGFVVSVHQNIS